MGRSISNTGRRFLRDRCLCAAVPWLLVPASCCPEDGREVELTDRSRLESPELCQRRPVRTRWNRTNRSNLLDSWNWDAQLAWTSWPWLGERDRQAWSHHSGIERWRQRKKPSLGRVCGMKRATRLSSSSCWAALRQLSNWFTMH